MNNIRITVSGPIASGKTTLVEALSLFFYEQGFSNVTLSDPDLPRGAEFANFHQDRVEAIKHHSIEIVTQQTHRADHDDAPASQRIVK